MVSNKLTKNYDFNSWGELVCQHRNLPLVLSGFIKILQFLFFLKVSTFVIFRMRVRIACEGGPGGSGGLLAELIIRWWNCRKPYSGLRLRGLPVILSTVILVRIMLLSYLLHHLKKGSYFRLPHFWKVLLFHCRWFFSISVPIFSWEKNWIVSFRVVDRTFILKKRKKSEINLVASQNGAYFVKITLY